MVHYIDARLNLLIFPAWWYVQHDSRLETWRSDFCQDEGLSTLACKSKCDAYIVERHTNKADRVQTSTQANKPLPFTAVSKHLLFLMSLPDRWSTRWCSEAIQRQVSYFLLWHPWNVSNRQLDTSFSLMYLRCSACFIWSEWSEEIQLGKLVEGLYRGFTWRWLKTVEGYMWHFHCIFIVFFIEGDFSGYGSTFCYFLKNF